MSFNNFATFSLSLTHTQRHTFTFFLYFFLSLLFFLTFIPSISSSKALRQKCAAADRAAAQCVHCHRSLTPRTHDSFANSKGTRSKRVSSSRLRLEREGEGEGEGEEERGEEGVEGEKKEGERVEGRKERRVEAMVIS